MKHRLKKDLPFAKAGTEVEIINSAINILTIKPVNAKTEYPICDIPREVKAEWIEGVKPREWTLLKAHNGQIANATEGFGMFNSSEKFAGISEKIKVREVLE